MTLRLDDVADFEQVIDATGSGRRGGKPGPYSPTRRDFLKGVILVGTTVALKTVGLLPTARPALATDDPPGGWDMYPCTGDDCCDGLGTWVNDDNCGGCNNKPGYVISTFVCDTQGNHKGPDHGCYYRFRLNDCKDSFYDGWRWKMLSCCPNGRKNQVWRCTDGYYRDACHWSFANSICRYRSSSGQAC